MKVCPGCGHEVHAYQTNIEVTVHDSGQVVGGSRSIYGRLLGKGRMNFHNAACLKKWVDPQIDIPAPRVPRNG